MLNKPISEQKLLYIEIAIALIFSLAPLFVTFPFRINLFLAWEGAYRLAEGQIPFRDFGMPLGYVFWIIPAIFFKIFGPYLYTLIIAQAFINLVSIYFFRSILKLFDVPATYILFSVFIFCLSYSFINFWPWYNHSVFVYELIGLYFLFGALLRQGRQSTQYIWLALSAFFIFLSFFTKQDGGALAFVLCLALLGYISIIDKNLKLFGIFSGAFIIVAIVFIVPLLQYDFAYWFNYGQPPHYSRLNLMDFLNEIFLRSAWEKFYFVVAIIIGINKINSTPGFLTNRKEMLFLLLTLGILTQALLVQVTSYIPHNVNVYFHSFAFAYIISHTNFKLDFAKPVLLVAGLALILFWWSSDYWKYGERIVQRFLPEKEAQNEENVVSKNTWKLAQDTTFADRSEWVLSDYKSFQKIYMPKETVQGIDSIMAMDIIKKDSLKVLNMTELTPLAYEIGYDLEASPEYPLWFHQNVAFFDREVTYLCEKVQNEAYDLILFQTIPNLNNFFSYDVRDCIQEHYQIENRFLAPREIPNSYIEVYVKK